jgi:hypothetical protein
MSGPLADVYQVTFALITRVTASSGTETLVEVTVEGFARPRVTSGEDISCTGTGKLKRMIADLLRRQLPA